MQKNLKDIEWEAQFPSALILCHLVGTGLQKVSIETKYWSNHVEKAYASAHNEKQRRLPSSCKNATSGRTWRTRLWSPIRRRLPRAANRLGARSGFRRVDSRGRSSPRCTTRRLQRYRRAPREIYRSAKEIYGARSEANIETQDSTCSINDIALSKLKSRLTPLAQRFPKDDPGGQLHSTYGAEQKHSNNYSENYVIAMW